MDASTFRHTKANLPGYQVEYIQTHLFSSSMSDFVLYEASIIRVHKTIPFLQKYRILYNKSDDFL